MKKNVDFRNALGQPDEYFRQSVIDTLNELNREAQREKRTARPFPLRAVCAFAAALIIAAAGLTLTLRNGMRETMDGRVDMVTNAPAFLAAPDEKLRTIEAEAASIRFRSIRTDGYMIVLTAEAKPKKKGSLILPDTFEPETASPEVIGNKPDYNGQTVRKWAEEHAYSDVLYASLETSWNTNPRTAAAGFGIESWEIRDDGSAVLTVIGHYLSRTDTYDLGWSLRTQSQKYEESGIETFPLSLGTAEPGPVLETELASLKVREAFTEAGCNGIYMKIEAMPRHENSLLLYGDIDPYWDYPTLIGKTQDYARQTIVQWAREHGYEELLSVRFLSEYNMEIPTGSRQAAEKNGVTVFRVALACDTEAGEVLPEDLVKYEIIPWDLTKENTYNRNGTLQTSTLKTNEAVTGNLPFTVSSAFEEPEFLASYRMTADLTDNGPDQEMTVTFFRTSLSDYYEISVNTDTSLSYSKSATTLFRDEGQALAFGAPEYYRFNAVQPQADGWIIGRNSWQLPGDFPETLWMRAVRATDQSHVTICPMQKITAAGDPQVFETEQAVLTVREAVADKLGVYLTIDVKPKKENYLAVDMSVSPENNDLEAIGINPDFEGQTLRQWAKAHSYKLLFVNACLPSDVEIDHSNGIRIREDGSAVISICGKVLPDTEVYDVSWTAIPLDTAEETGTDLSGLPAKQETFPVRVTAETKTVKTVDTDYVTIFFQDAKVRGTVVSVPIVIRPKNEKVLPLLLPANIDLSPEVIGKTPDYRNQTILQWATEHGYEEILSVWIGSPENAHPTSDALLDAYPDAFTLQEDGSLTGTVTGSAVRGADLYELSWDITPYDMERAGTISSASSADALDFVKEKCGSFRIHIAGKAEAPEIITAAQKPQVFETELATFTVREAVADDTGVYFTVDVKPKDERVLVVDSDEPVDNIGPERIGQKSDFEHQSVSQWVLAHDYKLLTVRFSLSPDGSDSSPHSFVLKCRDVNKEDSDIVYIIDKAKPDTQEYTLYCDAALKGPFDDSKPGILKLADEHNVFFPVRVSAKKETVKTVESDLVTMTFHDAVSDGTGVFIPAEIRAKNEKTLPLLWDTNFLGSPEILGKTPDYPDQTVLQWAREHGYEDLMFITLASPNMSPTSDARLNGLSNVFSLQDDGSLAGTIAGCTIPGADLYGLYWSVIPYDMDKAEKSMRENHGLTLESEKQESGIVQIAVTDEPKDPNEPIFIYVPLDDLRSTETSPTKTLVVLSHGSRCDYIRLTSTDPKFVNYNRIILRGDGIDNNAFYDLHIPYLTSTDKGKDGRYVMILSSCSFPDNPPKTLTMRLDQSDADSTLEPIEVTLRRQP